MSGGDLRFFFDQFGPADVQLEGGDLLRDDGLETAVAIALFTDRRADADDVLPSQTDLPGGSLVDVLTGKPLGSKLWLLRRSNLTADTVAAARRYLQTALDEQIVGNGLASEATVETAADGNRLGIAVRLVGVDGRRLFYKWALNWQNQIARR